jgi:hypothetical protein
MLFQTSLWSIFAEHLISAQTSKEGTVFTTEHRLRTPNEAFFHPELLGLGRKIRQINSGAFGVFSAKPRTTDTQWRHKSKKSEKLGRCGRQKYALAVPKNLGLEFNFRPCSEGHFLSGPNYISAPILVQW